MTNAPPYGSPGAPHLSYTSPSSNFVPRRSSYASVAAGTAAAFGQNQTTTGRAGAFSHLANPNPPSPSFAHNQHGSQFSRDSRTMAESDLRMDDGVNVPGSWGRGGNMNIYSNLHGGGQTYGMASAGGAANGGSFFVPTYLRNSKYMEKIEAAHEAKLAAQREAPPFHSAGTGSLSSRSSNVSLHKLAPSHRGMTYEIVEHQPPEDTGGLTPLPSKWAETDKHQTMEIGMDGLDVRFVGGSKLHEHEAAAARADHPMPPQCGIYYYEVSIRSKGKDGRIGVGFSGPKVSLEKLPGWEPDSWGWHGDDGNSFCCQLTGRKYGPTFTTGDIVGCGINFMTGCAFFTKNGVFQGNAFRDLKDVDVYPSVGMKQPQAHLTVNFGQSPFFFDIDEMMKRETDAIREEIRATSVARLHPPLDESSIVKELVAQFLAHDGFVETAKEFAEEVRSESRALQIGQEASFEDQSSDEDLDASNRQQIRAAIMDGDIDKALKRTNAFYPQVLRDNPQVNFRLRCRKFVEMHRHCAELLDTSPSKPAKATNGHSSAFPDEQSRMDIDDQHNETEGWDQMETEEPDTTGKYEEAVNETLIYGQELKTVFQDNPSTGSAFQEIFSLFMYEDPRKSPQAHLLDRSGRMPVAEELNSAILVSLGKSSSAAIERLYQQIEVLVSDISEDGGAGAFINVRNDFLR